MGESKQIEIEQQISLEDDEQQEREIGEDGFLYYNGTQHDPDHLRPDKGGNQASDDYW